VSTSTVRWEKIVRELVERRGDELTRYAYLVCGDPDDARDLVQDALVKTFGRLRNGFSVSSAEAYVRRAILNGYLDRGRRATRWRSVAHLAAQPEEAEPDTPDVERRLDLRGELAALSPRERACVVLRFYDDLKVDDIALALGISPGAVKRYLSDGLGKLQASLSPPAATAPAPAPASGSASASASASASNSSSTRTEESGAHHV
jgi:RNA polymerase sigma factor (sigma-70 family)